MANILTIKHNKKDGDRLLIDCNFHAFREWLKMDDNPEKPNVKAAEADFRASVEMGIKSLFARSNVGKGK